MENPSNTEAANRADPETYWIQGRAWCEDCGSFGVFVARVDVKDLKCYCGGSRIPDQRKEPEAK